MSENAGRRFGAGIIVTGVVAAALYFGASLLETASTPGPARSVSSTSSARPTQARTSVARTVTAQPLAGSASPAATSLAIPVGCAVGTALPDRTCTPGAVLTLRQSQIATTVCAVGWATAHRPPSAWTTALKRRMIRTYVPGAAMSAYRLDALVPIETGGDHYAVANLWLEPVAASLVKDRVEDAAHRAVCSGRISLHAAQVGFMTDWQALGRALRVPGLSTREDTSR